MTEPSSEALAQALDAADCRELAARARQDEFHDFQSPHAMPEMLLVELLTKVGTPAALAVRQKVINGVYDATKEESDAWAVGPEAQKFFGELGKPIPQAGAGKTSPRPGHGPLEQVAQDALRDLAGVIKAAMPDGYGFALLMFPLDDRQGRMNYVSNAERSTMLLALKELIARWEGRL